MISLIVPAYNEEETIQTLYERVGSAAQAWGEDYEVIIVDDGSADRTLEACERYAAQDPHWKVVSLSRNFGHQAAVTAGLRHSSGEIVAVIDADLQDPPEVIQTFLNKIRDGFDVVYAIRTKRKEHLFKRAAYRIYYRVLARLATIDIPLDSGDFCVMSRRIVDTLNALPERNRFVRGLRTWVGFRQVGLTYERSARLAGEPKYSALRLLNLALDGIFNFSFMPLRVLAVAGASIGLFAFFAGALFLFQYITNTTIAGYNPREARGWTSLILAILFLGGTQLFGLGILGEYIGRIFEETKRRPTYIVARRINFERPTERRFQKRRVGDDIR